jgi:superfamily II DNA or RNA helicase
VSYTNIVIDNAIRLNQKDLPKQVLDEIFKQLRVINPQKKIAEREMLWNAKSIPSHLELWKYNGHNELILPRGFINQLENILINNKVKFIWKDKTSHFGNECFHDVPEINLREYQLNSVEDLSIFNNGIYKSPTGSGKTLVMLDLIRQCEQPTIIMCEKTDIAEQWVNTAISLGFHNVGYFGNEYRDVDDLTISLRQSIWSAELSQDWFNQWGMVVLDECHHASAETMFELLQRFPARYRFGCSATPDSDPDLFPIARAVIGPVVAETNLEEIGDHLVNPSVKVVKTDFEFPYRPTVRAEKKIIRNNYNDMISMLQEDNSRNSLICKFLADESFKGHKCLVVSDRIDHLETLHWKWHKINNTNDEIGHSVLTGENSNMANEIREEIENYNDGFILFSTLAKEGTDIPILDRLFLVYPGRKIRGFEQSIGRIMRPHSKKNDAIVYDFRDYKVPILNSQYRNRAQNIYNKKGYKVETINV